jgi:hypothetical protein
MRISLWGMLALGLMNNIAPRLQSGDQVDTKAVVERAIEAMGGREKLTKSRSSISKGHCKFYGMGRAIDCSAEWHLQLPEQLKVEYHMDMGGKSVTRIEVITKDAGWLAQGGKVQPLTPQQLAEIHEGLQAEYATTLLPLAGPGYRLTSLGESVVGDRPAVGIKASHDGHTDVLLYFDKDRGYLLKATMRTKQSGREVQDEFFYTDYRDYDGVRNSAKTTTKRDGTRFLESEIAEFKAVEKLPDGTFTKPPLDGLRKAPAAPR